MHIGLIGGIGPAATDFYYRRLISTFASKKAALQLTIVHADTPTLLGNLANNDAATQVAIFMKLANRLAAAGADCVAITSVAGHFCIDAFKASSVLPVVDMISEVDRAIEQRAFERIGILGTRTVMETRLYAGVPGVEIVPPSGRDLEDVHEAYVAMAASGIVTALIVPSSPRSAESCLRNLASRQSCSAAPISHWSSTNETQNSRSSTAPVSMRTPSRNWPPAEIGSSRKVSRRSRGSTSR